MAAAKAAPISRQHDSTLILMAYPIYYSRKASQIVRCMCCCILRAAYYYTDEPGLGYIPRH